MGLSYPWYPGLEYLWVQYKLYPPSLEGLIEFRKKTRLGSAKTNQTDFCPAQALHVTCSSLDRRPAMDCPGISIWDFTDMPSLAWQQRLLFRLEKSSLGNRLLRGILSAALD